MNSSRVGSSRVGDGAGVHWFVAWRYLLAELRQLSRPIVSVIGACLWTIVGFGVVALWLFPLAHPILSPFQPLPWWLVIAIGVFCAGSALAPVVSGRLLALIGAAALFKAMSGALFGAVKTVARSIPTARAQGGPANPYALLSGISCGVVAINLFGLFWLNHRPFTEPPIAPIPASLLVVGAVMAFAITFVLPPALRWYVNTRAQQQASGHPWTFQPRRELMVLFTGVVVAALAVAIGTSWWGFRHVVWPARESVPYGNAVFIGAVSLVVLGLTVSLIVASLGSNRRAEVRWHGVRLVWLGTAALTLLGLFHVRTIALHGMLGGSAELARLPSAITLPILVAGALLVLGSVLLVIRFFFTFFSTVSIGGVAIGSMALVIVLSVMSGFENDLRRKILGSNAHALVTRATDKALLCRALPELGWRRCVLDVESAFTDYRAVGERINAVPGVVASSPYLISEVVIAANNNYANVIIKGAEPETVGAIGELDENVRLESGAVDADALQRLWPLSEDGKVIGRPADDDRRKDDNDDDLDGDGFSDAIPDVPEPVDFSGADADADADAGADAGADADADADAGAGAGEANPATADDDADKDLEPIADEGPDIPIGSLPPLVNGSGGIIDLGGDIDIDKEFVRHIPPLVAILPGTLVGKELVKQINLYDGQEVKIVSPLGQDTPLGPVPRTKRFRVAGTFFTGMYEYDLKFIYIELGYLQDFLDLGDEVTGIEIRVTDPSDTAGVVARLGGALGPEFRIQDWKELNRSLFSALKLEKIAMFLVLAIIILVASFSIVGNLIMVVIEKAREIAVLKTLGTSDVGIMSIFITQGFFIGLVGTGLGVTLGLCACVAMQRFGLPLDPDVYYIDKLPIHIEPLSVALVFGAGIFISVIATLYPAYVAARMRPVNGLRYE